MKETMTGASFSTKRPIHLSQEKPSWSETLVCNGAYWGKSPSSYINKKRPGSHSSILVNFELKFLRVLTRYFDPNSFDSRGILHPVHSHHLSCNSCSVLRKLSSQAIVILSLANSCLINSLFHVCMGFTQGGYWYKNLHNNRIRVYRPLS
jgi:hypothetical protein